MVSLAHTYTHKKRLYNVEEITQICNPFQEYFLNPTLHLSKLYRITSLLYLSGGGSQLVQHQTRRKPLIWKSNSHQILGGLRDWSGRHTRPRHLHHYHQVHLLPLWILQIPIHRPFSGQDWHSIPSALRLGVLFSSLLGSRIPTPRHS